MCQCSVKNPPQIQIKSNFINMELEIERFVIAITPQNGIFPHDNK